MSSSVRAAVIALPIDRLTGMMYSTPLASAKQPSTMSPPSAFLIGASGRRGMVEGGRAPVWYTPVEVSFASVGPSLAMRRLIFCPL
ncbi:MAG: hypothetical protein NT031_16790 [Planctomycetota bacterium]|nr:hypothetical protein [Planctomycetota bacterium]